MGCGPRECPERYALADPIRQVPLPCEVLLVHGPVDDTVSIARSRDYARAAEAAGGTVELVEIPGPAGGHRRHIDPASAGWRKAREWLAGHALPPNRPQHAAPPPSAIPR
jgi:dipeptidyl aminopeptidase/acylaminoacyl peptidase